jgi:glycosyltransferase involved in cell wall biosynthesis
MNDPTRVIMAHSRYRELGGENHSFEAEAALLESADDFELGRFERVHEPDAESISTKMKIAIRTIWSRPAYRDLSDHIASFRPDVVHFQNTFPLLSPSSYHACTKAGVPVVQTLRNYRPSCVSANFFRDGKVCELCLGRRVPYQGVVHRCYKDSLAPSTVVATSNAIHNTLRTWDKKVTLFVTPTEFTRAKYIEAGYPADRIRVKPNFVHPDPGVSKSAREHALFVGRLAPEKGVLTLIEAWRLAPHLPLKIVGTGPVEPEARRLAEGFGDKVEFLGDRPNKEVLELMKKARLVVFPSEWYETFGRVIAEAFSCGTPVIAADIGAASELVQQDVTGKLYAPGDAAALSRCVDDLHDDADLLRTMGENARDEFLRKYTAERNLDMMRSIYEDALAMGVTQ